MKTDAFLARAREISKLYCITNGSKFRLRDFDPADTQGFGDGDRPRVGEALKQGVKALAEFQEMLWAQDRWAVLLVFQAMDAAGKDSTIKHVMSGVNPQGCQVFSFKAPSSQELDHDFLWRCTQRMPERGRIGVFNRSYYEEVLVVRVHPGYLQAQKLPPGLIGDDIWNERFEDIRNVERYLSRNGTLIRKFFLHVSKDEQKKRFLRRLDRPEKNWKFSEGDVRERGHWDAYMTAYEDAIRNTATKHAPWYVVPADHKWFPRLVVAAAILDALAGLELRFPGVARARRKELAQAREALLES